MVVVELGELGEWWGWEGGNENWVGGYLFIYLFCWSLKITYRAADLKALFIN